ncbi:Succinate dehydrogenase cytochrome b558 subunit [Roseimaritima multifibrata]|uniref:Succinate dehydrogenase cytochrome b558 subunit n=1 Tax=Roseimaritima multifibrata TaxID=1930274 RepID=A0A517MDC1_9BACT|nr:succinate dehydrogenase cytochrome b558 subunit [Roseimaritima multifibrata]QDS92777.1 Succinate dehydrogenase cytochrome b558 subunit [Roseimaritima multifibrata]
MTEPTNQDSFYWRHEFAIRRLHSLTGIVPLGAYMVVHLATNASVLNGAETFQRAVYGIHSLGKLLPVVEWGFIFAPLLFHGFMGVWIAKNGRSNVSNYPYTNNRRYVWQRVTGVIALIFLLTHVFHLHGWTHFQFWLDQVAHPLGMAQFRPYNAASSLARAMDNWFWPTFYLLGVLSCVFHLANGLWSSGITWGLWISAEAQRRATKVCAVFGLILTVVGVSAWWGAISLDPEKAEKIENRMYPAAVEAGLVPFSVEKRTQPDPAADAIKKFDGIESEDAAEETETADDAAETEKSAE